METKQGWCASCDMETTFYATQPQAVEDAPWRCCLCESPEVVAKPAEPIAAPAEEPAPEAPTLVNDLDHIRIMLTGPWDDEALQALGEGMKAASENAKEDGLGLHVFVVKKSANAISRSNSALVIPFRDRHGKLLTNTALTLDFSKRLRK